MIRLAVRPAPDEASAGTLWQAYLRRFDLLRLPSARSVDMYGRIYGIPAAYAYHGQDRWQAKFHGPYRDVRCPVVPKNL